MTAKCVSSEEVGATRRISLKEVSRWYRRLHVTLATPAELLWSARDSGMRFFTSGPPSSTHGPEKCQCYMIDPYSYEYD